MNRKIPLSAEACAERFKTFMETGEPVYDTTGQEALVLEEGEEFRQCYDPHDPARRDFPKFWFISDHGNLISLAGETPRWIQVVVDKQGYHAYHFLLDEHIKTIKAHNLVGLVFGAERIGDAKKRLEQDGVYAFGTSSKDVNGHHLYGIKSHPEEQNSPTNIQFLTSSMHKTIESAPSVEADTKTSKDYMMRLSEEVGKELPKDIVAVASGEIIKEGTPSKEGGVAISTLPMLKLTEAGMRDFVKFLSALNSL